MRRSILWLWNVDTFNILVPSFACSTYIALLFSVHLVSWFQHPFQGSIGPSSIAGLPWTPRHWPYLWVDPLPSLDVPDPWWNADLVLDDFFSKHTLRIMTHDHLLDHDHNSCSCSYSDLSSSSTNYNTERQFLRRKGNTTLYPEYLTPFAFTISFTHSARFSTGPLDIGKGLHLWRFPNPLYTFMKR